jgi:SPP1 family predicted phage head-tail adaptor
LDIGKYKTRITIIQDINRGQNITDDNDNEIENWQSWKTVWARKQGLQGRVFYQAEAVKTECDILFTIRYMTGITTDMRIKEGTDIYRIKVPPQDIDGRKQEMVITASIISSGS